MPLRVRPIGKPSLDWSTRKQTTKGHTESHQVVQMGKGIDTAKYRDVLRIHKASIVSPRRGVVHEKVYDPLLKKDKLVSHEVVEIKQGKATYWKKVN